MSDLDLSVELDRLRVHMAQLAQDQPPELMWAVDEQLSAAAREHPTLLALAACRVLLMYDEDRQHDVGWGVVVLGAAVALARADRDLRAILDTRKGLAGLPTGVEPPPSAPDGPSDAPEGP